MEPYMKYLLLSVTVMERIRPFCSAGTLPANWRDFIHPDVLLTVNNDQSRYDSDMVEGDISGVETGQMPKQGAANALNDKDSMWPNNTLPYDFSTQRFASFGVSERRIVEEAMQLMMLHTRQCVKFVPRTTEDDYIRFQKGIQSFSNIGRTGGKQAISLSSGCLLRHGCIQHEIMHALGFYHEQSRMDRDGYVLIISDNIAESDQNQFEKHTAGLTYNLPYDYESVMHYELNAFAQDRNLPTILPKSGRPKLGQQEDLSVLDVARIVRRFKCSTPPAKAFLETVRPEVQPAEPDRNGSCGNQHAPPDPDTVTHSGGCRPLELNGIVNATWLMRDADTLWSLNHTATAATVRHVGLLELSSDCQVRKLTGTTNAYGEISLLLPRRHGLQMLATFEVAGYYPITLRDVPLDGDSDALNIFMEPLLFIPRRFTGSGISTGTLRDFSEWTKLSGVRLDFRSDMSSYTGITVESVRTSGTGIWSVTLPGGHYTVTAFKTGYITVSFTVTVIGGKSQDYGVTGLSPILDNGAIRIVSLGGNETRNIYLPVHVRGPVEGRSERFHFRVGYNVGSAITDVVKREVGQYEMQSVLVMKQLAGICRISVSDWNLITAYRRGTLWDMANLGARIQLYTGNKLWAQYYMPNRMGNAWSVVEINGTHLNPVNEVNTVTDVNNVN